MSRPDRKSWGYKVGALLLLLVIVAASFGAGWMSSQATRDENPALRGGGIAAPASGGIENLRPGADASMDGFLGEMRRLQQDMDRMFVQALGRFEGTPAFDRMLLRNFNQAMNVLDEEDRYVVEVNLPEQDVSNVDVKLDGQLLSVGMTAEEAEQQALPGGESRAHLVSSFAQTISLPGPVKSDQMKVEREKGRLVIAVPKA